MYKLIIADDEPLERKALALIAAQSGLPFTCIEAKNGREAVERALDQAADAALLDIKMPAVDGIQAAEKIRERLPDCLIVFLTAWSVFDYAQTAVRLGARDYIVKPAETDAVIGVLSRLVRELDSRTSSRRAADLQMNGMLELLEMDFFNALKYGGLSAEKIRCWLSLQHIRCESGFSFVFSAGNDFDLCGGAVLPQITGACRKNGYVPCCFEERAVDGTVLYHVLVFSEQPENAAPRIDLMQFSYKWSDFRCGEGMPFRSADRIASSLQQSLLAYLKTNAASPVLHYRNLPPAVPPLAGTWMTELESGIIHALSEADEQGALLLSAEYFDRLMLEYGDDAPAQRAVCMEMLLVVTRSIEYKYRIAPPVLPSSADTVDTAALRLIFQGYVHKTCTEVLTDRRNKYERIFNSIEEYLHIHFAEPISLETVAEFVGIDSDYCCKLFKKHTSISFVEYLSGLRLDAAAELLKNGKPVADAARNSGYQDPAYFSRAFKKKFGLPPKQFQLVHLNR